MFTSKKDILRQFFLSKEGKKIIAYGELFLKQLTEQIQNDVITDLSRDCRFFTDTHEYRFVFSQSHRNILRFIIYNIEEDHLVLDIKFDTYRKVFLLESYVYLFYKNSLHFYHVSSFNFFDELLSKIRSVDDVRYKEIMIPKEFIDEIEDEGNMPPSKHLERFKELMKNNRKTFSRECFTNAAHILKVAEKTISLIDEKKNDKNYQILVCDFTSTITNDLEKIILDCLDDKDEEKFSLRLNKLYLRSLDIQEFHR